LRCNPAKLLLDPYAKAVEGSVDWHPSLFSYDLGDPDSHNTDDSAAHMPKSVVVNPYFDWGVDRPPKHTYADSVIYEAHVKGLTKRNAEIPAELRGTYAGIAHPVMLDHLTALGVTAVELMPVHHFVNDSALLERGLSNYWGYNTISFFAPDTRYSSASSQGSAGGQVQEFKAMVRALHDADIEVILDVVYNHTAEGNHLGPTLCFRGIDNRAYYRLEDDEPQYYRDYTGTGNSLNVRNPHALQLLMDSLRYWVLEMHVDGFRFDLASALAREFYDVDRLSSFFELVQQDPVVSQVKLIAEPWDVGPGGYQVGNFPPQWTEWNGKYRDTVRDFWRGEPATIGEFAARITGSADLYEHSGRRPVASINFVTCHDGFTLLDLVSYNDKHNEANGEENKDGESYNRSWNCGVEGPSRDPAIRALRAQQRRNFIATLFLSQGVPMLAHGDELGRTQSGNNNGYCQDSELTWVDWTSVDVDLLAFTRQVAGLRRQHPVFRRRRFFDGRPVRRRGADALPDIAWFTPEGDEMTEEDWEAPFGRAIAVYLNGQGIPDRDARGDRVVDESFLLCFSAHSEPIDFHVPNADYGGAWHVVLDTGRPDLDDGKVVDAGGVVPVGPRALVVLQRAD
jgi:glycogen operon protein